MCSLKPGKMDFTLIIRFSFCVNRNKWNTHAVAESSMLKKTAGKWIHLSWSPLIGLKASQSWWRLKWVLLPPQHLLAVIPLPLLAVPLCPTVCNLVSYHLSNYLLYQQHPRLDFPISQAQNQFLPLSVLSLVPLTLKQMVHTVLSATFFFPPACFPVKEMWPTRTIYCGISGCLLTTAYHMNHVANCQF